MYHIDRNNKMQLALNEILKVDKGVPNNTLKAFIYRIKNSPGADKLIDTLTSFGINDKFPLEKLYNQMDLDNFDSGDRLFIHKYRVELIYEFIRAVEHGDNVSRFEGLYLTNNPKEWMHVLKAKNGAKVYRFEPIAFKGEEHDALWPELSIATLDFEKIYNNAQSYWSGAKTDNFRSEILCVGEFKVVEKETIDIAVS
ncbi:hypothetical protein H7F15_06185 [Pontibacter sp. Tf4]|uniref:hypothetical protein n=1 Tax=Pontibacter sp. Tf4 TaxID=2761620 RepID=UPI001629E5A2|nr:hypothetical protein [Pontibacter sp. Tf4]MBB6610617.1 hypothetical protein [Pontibacter sp. Tf4]